MLHSARLQAHVQGTPTPRSCTHLMQDLAASRAAFCPAAGTRTGYPYTTVVPSCDFNRSEANYHRQQDTALRYLINGLAKVRPNVDLWYLMGPFYECPGRRRIGRPVDGGQHDTHVCLRALACAFSSDTFLPTSTTPEGKQRATSAAVSCCHADVIVA